MAKQVFLDARYFVSGADLSGWGNKISVDGEWEAKKVTNWRSGGAEELLGGLGEFTYEAAGQWEAGDLGKPDDLWWNNRRVIEPWSVGPTGASDLSAGNLMWLGTVLRTKAKLFDAVGEVAPWEFSGKASGPLVRGLSLHPSGVPRTATGNGTSVQAGAVASGKSVYANLHVISIAGTGSPSLTVQIQSDDATGFPSPTVRGSFAAATALGGQSLKIPGPFTDDWWRVAFTITGTSPSFLFLVSLGIE